MFKVVGEVVGKLLRKLRKCSDSRWKMGKPFSGLAAKASWKESHKICVVVRDFKASNVEFSKVVPRVSLSLVFVKFWRFKVFRERGHVQCAVKWVGANILKRIVFTFAPSL